MKNACKVLLLIGFIAGSIRLVAQVTPKPKIVPLQTVDLVFSINSTDNQPFAKIKTADGKPAYILSLEPYRNVRGHLTGLELTLHRPDKTDTVNLLEPAGMWHGLQGYDFPGADFAQGVEKSTFGEARTIPSKRLRLVVRITVTNAAVSKISAEDYQFDKLNLRIEVGSLS
jgi:hypothetical protein